MGNSRERDFYFEVSAGNIPNHKALHKFGHNPTAQTATPDFVIISEAGGTVYAGFNATAAEIVNIVSSDLNDAAAGSGARKVEVFGLDENFEPQTEIVTLNGLTPVPTTKTYIRMDRAIVREGGSPNAVNAGIITGVQSTSAHEFFRIAAGDNQTMQAVTTIPAGKKGLLISRYVSTVRRQTGSAEGRIVYRPPGEVFQVKEQFDANSQGTSFSDKVYKLPKNDIPPMTDIFLAGATTDAMGLSGAFAIVLVDI